MSKLIDFELYPIQICLKNLLIDKTTKKNIVWNTNAFEHFGMAFDYQKEIPDYIFKKGFCLVPRTSKTQRTKVERTRKNAEVFTPAFIVNEMNNYLDEEWFGKKNTFNEEKNNSWLPIPFKIEFPNSKTWQDYILSRRLEITCGEAPYLVSRYDVNTGEKIEIKDRIGILDRKLRIVNENTNTKEDWIKWAKKAFESTFAFEYQGDNLLLARINLLMTFVEYFEDRWDEKVDKNLLRKISNIISWNIWQMDGLEDTSPNGAIVKDKRQINMFDEFYNKHHEENSKQKIFSRIYDWRANKSRIFKEYKENDMKKFDFVIGNPPYHEFIEIRGEQPSVYNLFYDEAIKISNYICFITPARFLFDAGKTPSNWNQKFLNSEHFKVLKYEPNATKIFSNTDIKGGVAITSWNNKKTLKPIKFYIPNKYLRNILEKVLNKSNTFFSDIIYSNTSYKYTKLFYSENPNYLNRVSGGSKRYLSSSAFDKFPEVFLNYVENTNNFIKIIGRQDNKRKSLYIKEKYINPPDNFLNYKLVLPSSNGSGSFGEIISSPFVGKPKEGYTETFVTFGKFRTSTEANNCLKYIKTKFARAMLNTKKVTQGNKNAKVWTNVPMQDFTENSDIDWSVSIAQIDKQLYKKYKLDEEEINFIESKVKEMK
ncbi:Eco57I restriction-modification methylase domain-containing protein [Peptoniphilus lacrimalis]|uniref:Eco57I restriction endonuclease n=1 Tax=Peptoniphilus lacrimalis 315-B TaxID=596330 RepID=D1VU49_9FIRM|nr:Eco57I restriction-modification methylase domain-containing protein [Peptoniphilus lacrimalis]EFA89928.1 Eco57I restriction endonuclease [Peptoniphilus lacrimalis 315-B]